ncbi:MAG TPA: phytanoyl-CoA dioxygenase family protein [Tepidisphaeraceae bacterium]|jgi:ectoine hydroxylase-related dioxygenase (phytanoyl-CoA dioxygenase family)|nr:phytanoyl-CoA dioxygenase family protein [Tepidisphaeraceae bacterium]
MTTISYPSTALHRLSDSQRAELVEQLDADGFFVLPGLLPDDLMGRVLEAVDRAAAAARAAAPGRSSVKIQNIVDVGPAFVELLMYEPALQLAYDCFGPMFHLCQSNLVSRPRDKVVNDFVGSSPWHADGPRPAMFPAVNGAMGLHYLKFGYFLSDLTQGTGGSLQIVRGSHHRPERDGKDGSQFRIEDYRDDVVQIDCPAGTVVGFHQAQWHAAPPNQSDIPRKNCYISYCPTWMRPLDREYPTEVELRDHSPEQRWILGEPRPAIRWWLPSADDVQRLKRFRRDRDSTGLPKMVRYD